MGRKKLTREEEAAYRDLSDAARRLREAQERARQEREAGQPQDAYANAAEAAK